MSADRKSRLERLPAIPPKGEGTPLPSTTTWRAWVVMLGVLCALWAPDRAHSADLAFPFNSRFSAPFNFLEFTAGQRFRLNTLQTTPFGKAWADILVKPENFLQCKGASIALCYYSGPETPASPGGLATPCKLLPGEGIADCTCYEIPAGPTYLVDINAILNLDVYLETVKACGHDGARCKPNGNITAPVCDAINQNTLIPGADLISTFSLYLESVYPTSNGLTCNKAPYAGCMTAPCRRGETEVVDPVTGLPLVQCACPIWSGEYQVGFPNGNACALGGNNVWSAAFAPLQQLLPPPPPPQQHCWPDTFGASACPLLLPNPPFIPPPPPNVSCKDVCSEYKKSSHFGVEIGFTCDATLCTASSDPFLVNQACAGLTNSSVSEILKLEVEVGYSCAASQICGCTPTTMTNKEIFRLNAEQRARGIATQCDLNGTLCGQP
jgi:hypothetical protein